MLQAKSKGKRAITAKASVMLLALCVAGKNILRIRNSKQSGKRFESLAALFFVMGMFLV